jgi:hypothetical protein
LTTAYNNGIMIIQTQKERCWMRNLPEFCYSTLPSNKEEMIIIKAGEKGYYRVDPLSDAYLCSAERNNELIGVTKAQQKAMEAGSMFGWNVPASDPSRYDAEGNWIREA